MEKIITYNFSQDFIEELTELLDREYISAGKDMGRVAIVFEGGRPAIFLKQALASKIKKGFFPPRVFEVDEFVGYMADKLAVRERVSDLEAAYIVYKISKKAAPGLLKGRGQFAAFLPWSHEILNFIDKADMENVEPEKLVNVELKARIGYDIPPAINEILANIVTIMDGYHKELTRTNKRSKGMVYKDALSVSKTADLSEFEHIIFANVLSVQKTQMDIIKDVRDRTSSTLLFQGGGVDWPVIKNISLHMGLTIEGDTDLSPAPVPKIYSCFDTHSQAALVRELVKDIPKDEKTLILLPDALKVVPLLSELSMTGQKINVSMGYPLKRSALYSLFKAIFDAQETRKGDEYYARDYLKVMMHPFAKNMNLSGDKAVTRIAVHSIEECLTGKKASVLSGSLFVRPGDVARDPDMIRSVMEDMDDAGIKITPGEVTNVIEKLHERLFTLWNDAESLPSFAKKVESLVDTMLKNEVFSHHPLDMNIAERIFGMTEELGQEIFRNERFKPEEIFNIFLGMLENTKVKFRGSPLTGIQVLGLWETRLLNFSNIIVMDMNEGLFPKLKKHEALIPSEIMLGLGLERPSVEEEIQRYHFTRLLKSAKAVSLIYDGTGKNEKSRFLEDILWENEKKASKIGVLGTTRVEFDFNIAKHTISIAKTEEVLGYLAKSEFSASSINTYINCPLSFYYRYALGLKAEDNELDEIDSAEIGTFIHEFLEDMYTGFIGKKPVVDARFRERFFHELGEKFDQHFKKKMRGDSVILKEIMTHRMKKFVENEELRLADGLEKVLCLEEEFRGEIKVRDRVIRLKAIVDRIDEVKGKEALILDYKTGGSAIMPSAIEKLREEELSREMVAKKIKSVQLPLYIYLAGKDVRLAGKRINASLYNLRNSEIKPFFNEKNSSDTGVVLQYHLGVIRFILGEIIDKDVPFVPCKDNVFVCNNCPYTGMCR